MASVARAAGNASSRMAAGCPEPPRAKAASEGPGAGPARVVPCLEPPTYAAARALLGSRCSCLVAGPHRRHIALAPRHLHRKRSGIREQLDAQLLRYSERCRACPLAAFPWAAPARGLGGSAGAGARGAGGRGAGGGGGGKRAGLVRSAPGACSRARPGPPARSVRVPVPGRGRGKLARPVWARGLRGDLAPEAGRRARSRAGG